MKNVKKIEKIFKHELFLDALFRKGFNTNTFAIASKISPGTISTWRNVKNIKKIEHRKTIERVLGIPYDDLCVPADLPQVQSNTVPMSSLHYAGEDKPLNHDKEWPVIGTTRGGEWIEAIEDSEYPGVCSSTIKAPDHIKDDNGYALKVIGDSMIPKFPEGSTVLVSPNAQVQEGDYVVAIVENRLGDGRECCLKQIHLQDDAITLHSLNSKYKDIVVEKRFVIAIHRVIQAWITIKEEF